MATGFSYFSYCFTFFARRRVKNFLLQNVGFSSLKLDLDHAFTMAEGSVCGCFCPCSALNQVRSQFFAYFKSFKTVQVQIEIFASIFFLNFGKNSHEKVNFSWKNKHVKFWRTCNDLEAKQLVPQRILWNIFQEFVFIFHKKSYVEWKF